MFSPYFCIVFPLISLPLSLSLFSLSFAPLITTCVRFDSVLCCCFASLNTLLFRPQYTPIFSSNTNTNTHTYIWYGRCTCVHKIGVKAHTFWTIRTTTTTSSYVYAMAKMLFFSHSVPLVSFDLHLTHTNIHMLSHCIHISLPFYISAWHIHCPIFSLTCIFLASHCC